MRTRYWPYDDEPTLAEAKADAAESVELEPLPGCVLCGSPWVRSLCGCEPESDGSEAEDHAAERAERMRRERW